MIEFRTNKTEIIRDVEQFIEEWNNTEATIIVQTSGSTGNPKQITLQKKHLRASALMTADYLKIKSGDTALLCLSTSTIAGKMMIVRSLVLDLRLVIIEPNKNPLENLNKKIDFVAMVPMQALISIQKNKSRFKNIQTIIIGGAPISQNLEMEVSECHSNAYQTFGMTETISHIAMRKILGSNTPYNALTGITFTENDDCLVVNAPDLGVNELKTTDVVDIISEKSFNWKGRSDFIINSGGIKIHPEEVESKLVSLIKMPFFSSSLPDEELGEKQILCIEGSIKLTKQDLSNQLDSYSIPKEIYCFKKFIYTESNKINRFQTLNQITNAKKQIL